MFKELLRSIYRNICQNGSHVIFRELHISPIRFDRWFGWKHDWILCNEKQKAKRNRSVVHLLTFVRKISSMLLVYISLDRFIAVKYPSRRFAIRKDRNQLIYLIGVCIFNVIYYIPIAFENSVINLTDGNTINETDFQCSFTDMNAQLILSWMETANSVIVPFFVTFS